MRDSVDDLLSSLKDRFTNPLVFAYLSAWIAWNWRIIVALFWTHTDSDNFNSVQNIIDYVSSQLSPRTSITYPLFTAVLLVLALPVAKALLQIFLAYVNRKGTDSVLAIKAEGGISVRNYIKLRKEYRERTTLLEQVLEQEQTTLEEQRNRETELLTLRTKLNATEKEVQVKSALISKMLDIRILDGWWRNDYKNVIQPFPASEIVYIENGKYITVDVIGGHPQNRKHKFNIVGFTYHPPHRKITFIKEVVDQDLLLPSTGNRFNYNDLTIDEDGSILVGTENRSTQIRYERIEL